MFISVVRLAHTSAKPSPITLKSTDPPPISPTSRLTSSMDRLAGGVNVATFLLWVTLALHLRDTLDTDIPSDIIFLQSKCTKFGQIMGACPLALNLALKLHSVYKVSKQ